MYRSVRILVVGGLCALIACTSSFSASLPAQPLSWQEMLTQKYLELDQDRNTGVAVAVIEGGQVVAQTVFGQARRLPAAPVTLETRFAIGSLSKTLTSALLYRSADAEEIVLDAPLRDQVPGFHFDDPAIESSLTFRQLLTMSSGIASHDPLWLLTGIDANQIATRFPAFNLSTDGRGHFNYNNIGFAMAAHYQAQKVGRAWSDQIREAITEPLQMTRTCVKGQCAADADHAEGHFLSAPIADAPSETVCPAGCIQSSIADMTQWLRTFVQPARAFEPAAAFESYRRTLVEPTIMIGQAADASIGYAPGWFVLNDAGRKLAFHSGTLPGFKSMLAVLPESRSGFVILTNDGGRVLVEKLAQAIATRFLVASPSLATAFRSLYANSTEDSPGLVQYPHQIDGSVLFGTYENEIYGTWEIRQDPNHGYFVRLGNTIARMDFTRPNTGVIRLPMVDQAQAAPFVLDGSGLHVRFATNQASLLFSPR
ncbi:MAG: serine hydrolase domain-containing protein [Bacteriovoracia bacterium]